MGSPVRFEYGNSIHPPPPPTPSEDASPNTTTTLTTYSEDEGDVDPANCILYALLTSGSSSASTTTSVSVHSNNGDRNNNSSGKSNFLHSDNNGVSWKAKPSWSIYVADQGDNLPKFNLQRNLFYVDGALNQLVSLSLADTCISKFAVDAIVNSTTGNISWDAGVSKTIHEEAGPFLTMACASIPPFDVGQVVLTEGFNLPAKYIIHTNGPYGMGPGWEASLQSCYQKSLQLLIDRGLRTIVFPCISTGRKSVDPSIAARIGLITVRRFLEGHRDRVDRVIFSLHNNQQVVIYRRYMQWFFPVDVG